MEIGRLRTSNGDEIEITQEMLDDFSVLSSIYSVSVEDFFRHIFDSQFEPDAAGQ